MGICEVIESGINNGRITDCSGHASTPRTSHGHGDGYSIIYAKINKTAPRSPWQNPYVERLIGTLRRECLDHVVVLNETHLRRLLSQYLIYYHRARTLSLDKDTPEPRPVERPDQGGIVEMPMVGGLHHQYTRRAA
jgi:Integrase core domain